DGSGTCDVEDMKTALTNWNRLNSFDIHIVANRTLAGQDSSSVVTEVNNSDGYAFRFAEDEPAIAPCRMILSNHHRVLRPPVGCYRYSYLMDSLTTNPDVTLERLWNFMEAVGWPATPGAGGTIQTMIFMPEQLKMGLAFATPTTPSYSQVPEWIEWLDIFPNHEPQGIEGSIRTEQVILISPNPSSGIISISYSGNAHDISVYDTAGRKISVGFSESGEGCQSADLSSLPEGIYRISVRIDDKVFTENVVIIR
ncbi:MAG: T9SS type A sorting domain-containing protein, partial [Candidatus Aegiribacteria sp.]|nr:T9SS type A sorting domain-containing protein [Candidatus Aegiribacteria sp.]